MLKIKPVTVMQVSQAALTLLSGFGVLSFNLSNQTLLALALAALFLIGQLVFGVLTGRLTLSPAELAEYTQYMQDLLNYEAQVESDKEAGITTRALGAPAISAGTSKALRLIASQPELLKD